MPHLGSPDLAAPWDVPLTGAERALIVYAMAVAAFALLAMIVHVVLNRRQVGARYRVVSSVGLAIALVAFVSYLGVIAQFIAGYAPRGGVWMPMHSAIWSFALRYMEWSVSVPLLVVELIAVSALPVLLTRRVRAAGVVAAAAMILAGYLGAVVVDGGESRAALWTWGLVGTGFFVVLYAIVITTVLRSLPALPPLARRPYRSAMALLLVVWFVYPIVFGLQGFGSGGAWTAVEQILLSAADIAAKVGFGLLLHRVAVLRTAFDANSGIQAHGEAIWIEQVKLSD